MNDVFGIEPSLAARQVTVNDDGRVLVDGRRPAAGDGVAAALVALVDPTLVSAGTERAITVDQTNVSVIVDESVVVKIVDHWGAANRSARLLARLEGTPGVERMRGAVRWRHPERGDAVLAIVTDYLAGAQDGWTWAVDDVVAVLEDGEGDPSWPAHLGDQIARMHAALGVEARAADAEEPRRRTERARRTLTEAAGAVTGDAGVRLRNRVAAFEEHIDQLAHAEPGLVFPIHGDLHVGQILRSGSGGDPVYTVIDFDGAPQSDDREHPDAAARDVAHVLVSLDLVAAVAQKRLGRADARAFDWADRARADFLSGYRAAAEPGLCDDTLLPGLEAEQLAAELVYAARFLPRWEYAPDAALTHRFPSSASHPELPWTPPPSAPTST